MNKRILFFCQLSSMASLTIPKNSLITTRVRSAVKFCYKAVYEFG
jgi:hypothetical protein